MRGISGFEHYSARILGAANSAHWRRLMGRLSWPVDFRGSGGAPFEAELKVVALGPLSFRRNVMGPVVAERRAEHAAQAGEERFLLAFHEQGRLELLHNDRTIILGSDDFVLTDLTAPARLNFLERTSTLAVLIPGAVLRTRIPEPRRVCALPLSGAMGFARVLKELMLSVRDHFEEGAPMSPEFEARAVRHFLDLLATCYATNPSDQVESASVSGARLASVKQHIERHLCDPDLRAASIAEACGISSRYLRKLFATENDTVSRFIRRRRLEEAAHNLRSGAPPNQSVMDVAFGVGFNSAAHFTRAFRAKFGVTPREYRRDILSTMPSH